MSPLELIVLIGIISAFTAFALLAWASRGDAKLGPMPDSSPRRDDASNSFARPHSIRLILRRDRWFLRFDYSPIGTYWRLFFRGEAGSTELGDPREPESCRRDTMPMVAVVMLAVVKSDSVTARARRSALICINAAAGAHAQRKAVNITGRRAVQ
jgi:hypothetical protein